MVQILRPWKTILPVVLDSDEAVYRQIAKGIIEEIKRGRFKPGMALPGTRPLALDLKLNRKTVILAYDSLIAEGWLTSAYKQGTFVSDKLPQNIKLYRDHKTIIAVQSIPFSYREQQVNSSLVQENSLVVFNDGLPDVRLAPMNELMRAYKRIFQQNAKWRMMGYGDPRGTDRIREAIASMLIHDRGVSVEPGQLCITRGSQMALYLIANVLIEKGDHIAIENPGYAPAWKVFERAGAKLIPVAVDENGICVDSLEVLCTQTKVKAVYVTPHHQFPTTVSMKIDRRLRLIELSNQYGFAIIEDDYDHEFHFSSKSLFPLASHQNALNVIYIGSLSKIVAPALRIGYVRASQKFIAALAALRKMIDVQGDNVMEHAVAELMEEGAVKKHAKKAYAVYKDRRDNMEGMLNTYLGSHISFKKPEGGLAYWIRFNENRNTVELAARLLEKGVSIIPTEPFSFHSDALNALRLGYASLTKDEMEMGLKLIAKEL
ncbi:GntR family transcriptional regulator/MocR family aminotransferase [Pedobacter cryoconitis]|uniref:GntR family transcriptional regulator/MocR family aminotransferase n=1 Tax=Pedobacter cryoconitis TaxID=188932 RepID=A0A7W8ZQ74_9SPHI|nr:PLP-dependent aminotransferase family protein [Pedobacter cryoconitis]MBB5638189.1 GntR family transcriptional regulator/MocR family aminotransferase [Pedobacter cryoconitis]